MEDYGFGGDPVNEPTYTTDDFSEPIIDDYETASVTHHQSKTPYIITAIITLVIIIGWFIFIIITYNEKKVFWNYQRPLSLPNQVGETIFPTASGFNFPPDLKGRTVALGGAPVPVKNFEDVSKQAKQQAELWKNYTPPVPVPPNSVFF